MKTLEETGGLTANDYQNALDVQSACNLSGVVHSFSEVIERVWNEAHRLGKGTAWVNSHPICRLYAEQIAHLTGETDYFDASKICQENSFKG